MVEDILPSQRLREENSFFGSRFQSVTGGHIERLINLRKQSIVKDYPFSSDQSRSYEKYGEFVGSRFGVETARPETLIKMAATLRNSDMMPERFRRPVSVWDFGASPNALPELFSKFAPDIRSKVSGVAVNLYDHTNLGDKGDIQWRNANLESQQLFQNSDVVDYGFCIAVAPYLVDPFNFISRVREHISPTGSVWIAPFINYSRLHPQEVDAIDNWVRTTFGKNAYIDGRGVDRSVSLRVTRDIPLHIPVRPVLDIKAYVERYGRQGAKIGTVNKVIEDAQIHGHAPKLSYMLE